MFTPKQPDEHVNIPKENMLLQAFKLLVSLGVLTLILYLLLTLSLKLVISNMTPEQEEKVMEMSAWSQMHKVKPDPYLQSIVNKFEKCIDRC
jgi:hypothetical protein